MPEVDPLSPSTRGHRRSLVGTSATLFAVTVFGVTIENIQGVGLSIEFSQGLVGIIIMSCSFYFFVHFVLYFTNDLSSGAYSQSLDDLKERRSAALQAWEDYCERVEEENKQARKNLIKAVESVLKSGIIERESAPSRQSMPIMPWREATLLVDIASRLNKTGYSRRRSFLIALLGAVLKSQKSVKDAVERRLSILFFHKGSSLCFDRWLKRNTYQSSIDEFSRHDADKRVSGLPFARKQTPRQNLAELASVIVELANSTFYFAITDPEGRSRKRNLKQARRYFRWFYVRMWVIDLIVPIAIFAVAFFLALADPNISAGIHQMFYRVQGLMINLIDSVEAIFDAASRDAASEEPGFFCGWLGWTVAWSNMCESP